MTKTFEERKFEIPTLKGISPLTVSEHLKLYAGYVKHANLIQGMVEQYGKVDAEDGKYSVAEITRRFAFEFNGMRNHEIYFSSFEGGSTPFTASGPLEQTLQEEWTSYESWLEDFKRMALTRGVGWAMLGYDTVSKRLLNYWVDEQHLGQLNSVIPVLALDMWEHSFVADYQPSGKKQYVEDFFANLNWKKIEENFLKARNS
jgi:superoxide dismutase, Fe-Mn family